jgi:hypothetical protein
MRRGKRILPIPKGRTGFQGPHPEVRVRVEYNTHRNVGPGQNMGQKVAWKGDFDFQSVRKTSCIVILLTSIVKPALSPKVKGRVAPPYQKGMPLAPS